MGEIFDQLTKKLSNVVPLTTKSLISFIYAYNPDLENKEEKSYKECSEKLAYTDERKGFVTDDDETSFLQLLDSQKVYTSAGTFGASFVTDNKKAYNRTNLDKYFWIYLLLMVQRYSLIQILYDLNIFFGKITGKSGRKHIKLKELQDKYQEMCEIKAGLYFTEISEQYHNIRLYHKFFDGFNIKRLYEEVEEKMEALDKFVTIEKDKHNRTAQAILTILVLLLTVTSALNDLFDIIEDQNKLMPGIILLLVFAGIIIIFWKKIKNLN